MDPWIQNIGGDMNPWRGGNMSLEEGGDMSQHQENYLRPSFGYCPEKMGLFLFFFSMAWILLSSSTLSVAKKRSRFCYMEWSLFPYHHYLEVSHSAKAKKEPIEICAVFWILNDSKGTKIFKQNGCGRILIFYLQFKKFLSHLFPTLL